MKRFLALLVTLMLVLACVPAMAASIELVVATEAGVEDKEWFQASLDKFAEMYPDVEVVVEPHEGITARPKFVSAAYAGNAPDVLMANLYWVKDFAMNGWLTPLNEYFEEGYFDDFFPDFVDYCTVDGNVYGMHNGTDIATIVYRKSMLEEAGIEVPALTEAWTWEELAENAKKLNKDTDGDGPFTDAGIDNGVFGDERPWDDSDSIQFVTKQNGWDCRLICEGSFYETDDKVLHMLLRSNSNWLWLTESRDDGVTWTPPVKTEFSDDNTKFHCGRLPDGRWYVVSCPITNKGARNPLVISLSKDGEDFDQAYIIRDEKYDQIFEGLYKGGLYGYPHTLIHDGIMYVIYSKHKEAVEITRIKLSDIE